MKKGKAQINTELTEEKKLSEIPNYTEIEIRDLNKFVLTRGLKLVNEIMIFEIVDLVNNEVTNMRKIKTVIDLTKLTQESNITAFYKPHKEFTDKDLEDMTIRINKKLHPSQWLLPRNKEACEKFLIKMNSLYNVQEYEDHLKAEADKLINEIEINKLETKEQIKKFESKGIKIIREDF